LAAVSAVGWAAFVSAAEEGVAMWLMGAGALV